MEILDVVRRYNELCLKELPKLWGSEFSLGYTPEVKLGKGSTEHPDTKEMFVSEEYLKLYTKKIAEISKQPDEAGKLRFSAHAMNHLLVSKVNPELYGCIVFQLPTDVLEHVATVEAIVEYVTADFIDSRGFDGDKMAKGYFTVWEEQLIENGMDPSVAKMARGVYYTLKKMPKSGFWNFVRSYKSS
jgi:hypothetical protein